MGCVMRGIPSSNVVTSLTKNSNTIASKCCNRTRNSPYKANKQGFVYQQVSRAIKYHPCISKMATATRSDILWEQYKDLAKSVDSITDGRGSASVEENNCLENIFVTFYMWKNAGFFRGATIEFALKVNTSAYPSVPPIVTCLTEIYHPDIRFSNYYEDDDGSVYLSLVENCWNSHCTLKDIARALFDLVTDPDIDSTGSYNRRFYCVSSEEYEQNVRLSLRGESIDGVSFSRNLPDDYESDSEEEEDEQTAVNAEDVSTEESVEPVATKQTVEEPESTTEDLPAESTT